MERIIAILKRIVHWMGRLILALESLEERVSRLERERKETGTR